MAYDAPRYFARRYFAPRYFGGDAVSVECHDTDTSDMLTAGLSWLTGRLRAHVSQPVTYVRGNDAIEARATLGRKLLKLDDGGGGTRLEWTDMDFMIPASDLEINGSPIVPQRGDLVYLSAGGELQGYEVHPYGGTEPCWRWCDPKQSMLRIHTKEMSAEDC